MAAHPAPLPHALCGRPVNDQVDPVSMGSWSPGCVSAAGRRGSTSSVERDPKQGDEGLVEPALVYGHAPIRASVKLGEEVLNAGRAGIDAWPGQDGRAVGQDQRPGPSRAPQIEAGVQLVGCPGKLVEQALVAGVDMTDGVGPPDAWLSRAQESTLMLQDGQEQPRVDRVPPSDQGDDFRPAKIAVLDLLGVASQCPVPAAYLSADVEPARWPAPRRAPSREGS